jgi:hypothetical protein
MHLFADYIRYDDLRRLADWKLVRAVTGWQNESMEDVIRLLYTDTLNTMRSLCETMCATIAGTVKSWETVPDPLNVETLSNFLKRLLEFGHDYALTIAGLLVHEDEESKKYM